jgi:UDP-glucose 4-epimerase
MRVFIAGGAGFIGRHTAEFLLSNKGNKLIIFDNFSSPGTRKTLAHLKNNNSLKIIEGDIKNVELLAKSMEGCERVYHYASNPDIAKSMTQPDLDFYQGTLLTQNILEAMRMNGVKIIVYTSGSGIYGDQGEEPIKEDLGPLLPVSTYGASKLASESLISAYCHMFNMKAYIFRPANVVGKCQTHGVAYDFIRKLKANPHKLEILGDGSQSKSYIHVEDLIDAIHFVMENSQDLFNYYNVATDDYIDVKRIAEIVIEEMGLKNVSLLFGPEKKGWKGDVPIVRFNLDKIHRLGWSAKMNSEQAVRRSVFEMLGYI